MVQNRATNLYFLKCMCKLFRKCFYCALIEHYTLFYRQHCLKQYLTEIGKNQAKVNQHSEVEIYSHSSLRYHPKIIGHILKSKQGTSVSVFIRLIIIKMNMKMKKRSHRYDIKRPRSMQGHKYSKYKK